MEIITAQAAKNQFGDLLMKVQREPVEISKHGKRVAVVISAEEYDQLEDMKLAHLRAAIDEGDRDVEAGRMVDGPSFMESLRKRAALEANRKPLIDDL